MDDLIKKTTEVCKKAIKGDVFNSIKNKTAQKITQKFTERNKNIKVNVNRLIIENFINTFKKVILDKNQFMNYIADLMKIIFVGYLKNTDNELRELKRGSIDDFKKADSISKPIENYIKYYHHNSDEFVKPILSEKAIHYLDEQAKKEKYDFKKNMDIENKNNKSNFISIIGTFLNNNFYFISQKYIIYRFITDVRESLSEKVESEFNKIVKDYLSTNDFNELSKELYNRKMELLIKDINNYLKYEGYKEENNNYEDNTTQRPLVFNKNINNNNLNDVADYPPGPYPHLEV